MTIYHTISDLRSTLQNHKDNNEIIVFVPTMGALHDGHLSLIEKARKEGDVVICSIFVNPTQFNHSKDLKNYPRTPELDIEMLQGAFCDYIFMPDVNTIYPPNHKNLKDVDFGMLTSSLEAIERPGHFDGVINVVKRLFEIIEPDKACFGLKDFQQISIIKKMVKEFHIPVEIIGCPIIREESGLAMSSRNTLLKEDDKKRAIHISEILFKIRKKSSDQNIGELKKYGLKKFEKIKEIELEYLAFVNPEDFKPRDNSDKSLNTIVLFAGWIGGIRLIDNIFLE